MAGAFRRKAAAVDSLGADIAIIQECRRADVAAHCLNAGGFAWIGVEGRSGVAVIARHGWVVTEIDRTCPDHFFLPVTLRHDAIEFSVMGVWVKPAEDYLAPTLRAIEATPSFFAGEAVIMAGDFNGNVVWDRRGRTRSFAGIVDRLERLGLVSAWHLSAGERHGNESAPTFHQHRSNAKPYHIDYMFVRLPPAWRVGTVRIGRFKHWVASGLSDHLPLIADLELSSLAGSGQRRNEPRPGRTAAAREAVTRSRKA
jgi:hypothetical protein